MHKIAVVQFYDDAIKAYGENTSTINANYCTRNNYAYFLRTTPVLKGYHPAWERLPLILDTLHGDSFDYVVWVDADAVFNGHRRIEEFIERSSERNLIMSTDVHKHCSFPGAESVDINTGVMIFKNCSWSREFVRRLLVDDRCERWHQCGRGEQIADGSLCWWEQNCMEKFFVDNVMNCRSNSFIVNCEEFNTYHNRTALVYHMQQYDHDERTLASIEELRRASALSKEFGGHAFCSHPDKRNMPRRSMPNPEQVERLKGGVAGWNQWRKGDRDSEIDLQGVELRGLTLRGVDLVGANLRDADFSGSDLEGAKLIGAKLERAKFSGAILKGVDLTGADLEGTDLECAVGPGVVLRGARLRRTRLGRADLRGANLDWADAAGSGFGYADLRGASLTGTRLSETDWQATKLDRTTRLAQNHFEPSHDARSDRSDTISLSARDSLLNWSRLRAIGQFPIFGLAWSTFIGAVILVNAIQFLNERGVLERAVPMPAGAGLFILAALLLAIGSTFYRQFCPDRVQEFSETQWVDRYGRPRILYLAASLGRSSLQWPTLLTTIAGALLSVWLSGGLVVRAFRYVGFP